MKYFLQTFLGGLFILAVLPGCSTTQSTRAKPLTPSFGASANLSGYDVATVIPFANPGRSLEHPDAGVILANGITRKLQQEFPTLFTEVRQGPPLLGRTNELVITGIIRESEPGSRLGRAFGPGITPARFKAELHVKDALSDRLLIVGPIEKLWAWGGGLGASKGIEDMIEESAASVVNTIARARGWTPPPAPRTRATPRK